MRDLSVLMKFLFREHTIYTQIFTVIATISLSQYGYRAFAVIFWLKVVGLVFVSVLWYWFRSRHLYFFYQLGYGWRRLMLAAWLADFSLTALILFLVQILIN